MKNAILFAGQGAQYRGMYVELIKQSETVNKTFKNASDITGIDLVRLCEKGSEQELAMTENLQPLVFTCDIASWELLKENNVASDFFAGYSLGEYAALYAAGCCSLAEILELITIRANAMQAAIPVGVGGMSAVIFDDPSVVDEYFNNTKRKVWISNRNTLGQYSIAGLNEDMEYVCSDLKKLGALTKKVPVSVPFHCELLKSAADKIRMKLDSIQVKNASIPVVMNYDGLLEIDADEIKRKVCLQTYSTVQWIKTLNTLKENETTNFIECGPGHTLTNFTKRMRFIDANIFNVETRAGCDKVCAAMK